MTITSGTPKETKRADRRSGMTLRVASRNTENMDILVDFDNVEIAIRRAGLLPLCARLAELLAEQRLRIPARCRIRLYGGWYDRDKLTSAAQELSTEIQDEFPNTIWWSAKQESGKCVTMVEMAYGLEADPRRHLFYTHRVREFSDHLKCDTNRLQKCTSTDCSLRGIPGFFNNRKCPQSGCYTTPGDVLRKTEQKLVDTMLTADLIHLAKCGAQELVVVSSDDDLWPGIQTALLYGAGVSQIHTRNDRRTPAAYSTGLKRYRQATL